MDKRMLVLLLLLLLMTMMMMMTTMRVFTVSWFSKKRSTHVSFMDESD